MAIILGAHQYGKAENRVVRIFRDTAAPRDPRRERLQRAARRLRPGVPRGRPAERAAHRHPEEHGVRLRQDGRARRRSRTTASRSPGTTSTTSRRSTGARIEIEEYAWERVQVDGAGHDHTFVRKGQEIRTLLGDRRGHRRRRSRPGSPAASRTSSSSSRPARSSPTSTSTSSRRSPRPTTA